MCHQSLLPHPHSSPSLTGCCCSAVAVVAVLPPDSLTFCRCAAALLPAAGVALLRPFSEGDRDLLEEALPCLAIGDLTSPRWLPLREKLRESVARRASRLRGPFLNFSRNDRAFFSIITGCRVTWSKQQRVSGSGVASRSVCHQHCVTKLNSLSDKKEYIKINSVKNIDIYNNNI